MSLDSPYADTPMATGAIAVPGVAAGGIVSALWRARFWIAAPVMIATALAVVWLSNVMPLYRSTAKVLVESQETAYTRPAATVEERALLDQEAIRSQVQLILSADLSRRVVREVGLERDPEFNPASTPSLVARVLSLFGITRDAARMSVDEKVLDRYYQHLAAYQIDNSRVIAIEFSSQNPELAARVANAVADGYIEMQRSAKRDATREASEWLGTQIETLRAEVDEAERRAEEFRAANGLFSALRGPERGQTLTDQQLSELTSQLAIARGQKADAQAKARQIRDMLDRGEPIESTEVLNSPLIQSLVTQQVTLRAQVAELSATLGPRHPRMQQLEAQLGDLRRQVRDEAMRFALASEADAAIAAGREQDLLASIQSLETQVASSNSKEVELRSLERDAKSQRDLLETLLARYRDATSRTDLDALPADARLISRAAPAAGPYYPKTLATLVVAFLGSLLLACGIVVTLELVRSVNEYPAAGPLPVSVGAQRARASGGEALPAPVPAAMVPVGGDLGPPLARELAQLRDEIVAGSGDGRCDVVLFTSARATEGLGELAMRLARTVSASGRRVMVVDTAIAEDGSFAGDPGAPVGLGGLLGGGTAFEAVIGRDRTSRVHFIPAGRTGADPLMLLASDRMGTTLEALRQTYDVVLLLAPPVSRRGEARLLARRADRAVIVARLGADDAALRRARERLEESGLRRISVLTGQGTAATADAA